MMMMVFLSSHQTIYFLFTQFADAYQHVKENLSELNGKAGANETDLVFLRGLLDSPAVTQLIKVSVTNESY